jgi:hypothetical protein
LTAEEKMLDERLEGNEIHEDERELIHDMRRKLKIDFDTIKIQYWNGKKDVEQMMAEMKNIKKPLDSDDRNKHIEKLIKCSKTLNSYMKDEKMMKKINEY